MTVTRYRTIVADPPWPYESGKPMGWQSQRRDFLPYATMTVEKIRALRTPDAVADAHLYLWTTNRFLWESRTVAETWGFRPLTLLTWCKPPRGTGMGGLSAYANTTEFILFCRRRMGARIRAARKAQGMTQAHLEGLVRGARANRLVAIWEADKAFPNKADAARLASALGDDFGVLAGAPKRRVDSTWFQWPRGAHSAKPDAFMDMVERVSPAPRLEMFARRQRLGWDTWGNEALEHVDLGAAS